MSIKKLFANRLAIVFCLVLVAIICLVIILEIKNDAIVVDYDIKSNSNVVPIVYLETGIGGPGYKTKSYIIDSNGFYETEEYERSFSKTFPTSALKNENILKNIPENIPENINIRKILRKVYGQLMVYYKTKNGSIYLFKNADTYEIIYNNNKATLKYTRDSSLFDINEFDDYFYIFCFDKPDEITGDFNEVVVYKYTKNLKLIGEFIVDLNKMNLSYLSLVNKSMAVKNDNLLFSVRYNERFYTVSYNLENENFNMRPVNYEPVSHVVSNDKIYSIGTKGSKFIIEEIKENNQIEHMEVNYPKEILPTFGGRKRFIYGKNNIIYGGANDEAGNTILYSYNMEKNAWDNWWTVRTKSNSLFADYKFADYKYVVCENETQFDLMPCKEQ